MTNEQRMVPADELRVRAEVSGQAAPSDSQGAFSKSRLKQLVTQVFGEGWQIVPQGEPLELAVYFHEAYERLAPSFGYETRLETRAFDPDEPNGKLMVAVCGELQHRFNLRPVKPVEPVAVPDADWYRCETVDQMQAFYLARLPAMRNAAKECGYALGLHGTLRRDLDLIAVPWVVDKEPTSKDDLAHAIQDAACGLSREGPYVWEEKPWGRKATAFPICTTAWHDMISAGHVDLSVMPKRGKGCEAKFGAGLAQVLAPQPASKGDEE